MADQCIIMAEEGQLVLIFRESVSEGRTEWVPGVGGELCQVLVRGINS